MTTAIQDRMAEIVDLMETQVVGEKSQDELSLAEKRDIACVSNNGIGESALSFTQQEVAAVADFVRTASPEVEDEKVGRIHAVISGTLNGKRARRDYYPFDPEKGEELSELNGKLERWERGEYEGEIFDREAFLDSIGDAYDRDEIEHVLRAFEDDPEDLQEYLDSMNAGEYMLACGPYTIADLEAVEKFAWPTWVSPINPKLFGKKGAIRRVDDVATSDAERDIFGEEEDGQQGLMLPMHEQNGILISLVGIDGRDCSYATLDEKLNKSFAAEQFVRNRSLGARNSVGLSAGFAQAILDRIPEVTKVKMGNGDPETGKEEPLSKLRRRLDLISKYAARICGFSDERLKKEYGSTRPITKEFFEECIEEAGSWTDATAEQKSNDYLSDIFSMSFWTEAMSQEVKDYIGNKSE